MRCAWLIVAAGLAACGGDDADPLNPDAAAVVDSDGIDAPPPRETVHFLQPLQVGELIEGIMHGGATDGAQIRLEAPPSSLSWNLHSHQNGGTQVVTEALNQTVVDFAFHPTADADWYLLMRNDGTTDIIVDVTVGLYGAMTWTVQ